MCTQHVNMYAHNTDTQMIARHICAIARHVAPHLESQLLDRLKLEEHEFEASLGYPSRVCLNKRDHLGNY